MTDPERSGYLTLVASGQVPLTMSGLTVTDDLLTTVLSSMRTTVQNPWGGDYPIVPTSVLLEEATFTARVSLMRFTISGHCNMAKAVFREGLNCDGTRFRGGLTLAKAEIVGEAKFPDVEIQGDARLAGIRTSEVFEFVRANVENDLDVRYANFAAGIWASFAKVGAKVKSRAASYGDSLSDRNVPMTARFDGIEVASDADFSRARFAYETTFGGYSTMPASAFHGHVSFEGARFGNARQGGRHLLQKMAFNSVDLKGCTFYGRVSFARSSFAQPPKFEDCRVLQGVHSLSETSDEHLFPRTTLDLSALTLRGGATINRVRVEGTVLMQFEEVQGGVEVRAMEAREVLVQSTSFTYLPFEATVEGQIIFSRCQFLNGGVISCASRAVSFSECDARQPLTLTSRDPENRASLIGLGRTNVEHFVLSRLDLSKTIFTGAVGLDKLRMEGAPRFTRASLKFGTGRQVIQDEVEVRSNRRQWNRLLGPGAPAAGHFDHRQVASVYRSLRKSREDSKDQPAARISITAKWRCAD